MEQFQGTTVKLKMIRVILDGEEYLDTTHTCKVITYKKEEGCIYLLTGKTEVTEFSLDGIYECILLEGEEEVRCTGMIRERYWNKLGKVLVFQIEKGFYKNPVN